MSAHRFLREKTRAAHDRVDRQFSSLNLANPADYGRFLTAHAAAFLPAEAALDRDGAAAFLLDWRNYRRSALLQADLAELGLAVPAPAAAPHFAGDAGLLGGLYVLEGSRLGGTVLRRSVGEGLPRRFLDSVQPPGRWRAFLATLDRNLRGDKEQARALDAALATFAMFEATEWDAVP